MALSNALHTKEITTAQINGLSFGFFTEEEVRQNIKVTSAKSTATPSCMLVTICFDFFFYFTDYNSAPNTVINHQLSKIYRFGELA